MKKITHGLITIVKCRIGNNIEPEKINEQCYEVIDEYYNPDYQLSVFERLITGKKPRI
jgi:hypothetical protein